MKSKNALLLAAVSAFALTMTTTTADAAYRCSWTDNVKYCGNDLGFVPATDGETIRRDRDSGDREPASPQAGNRLEVTANPAATAAKAATSTEAAPARAVATALPATRMTASAAPASKT